MYFGSWKNYAQKQPNLNYNLGFNDIDNDGDADVFVAEYSSSGTVKLYLNGTNGIDGTEEVTLNPFQSISDTVNYPHVTFADYDKDGKADAIFGGTDVKVYNKRIFTSVINGVPVSTESSKIFSSENIVSLKMENSGSIGIFNTTGSLVYQSEVKAGDSQYTIAGVPTGIYLVKVMLDNAMMTRKIFLK